MKPAALLDQSRPLPWAPMMNLRMCMMEMGMLMAAPLATNRLRMSCGVPELEDHRGIRRGALRFCATWPYPWQETARSAVMMTTVPD